MNIFTAIGGYTIEGRQIAITGTNFIPGPMMWYRQLFLLFHFLSYATSSINFWYLSFFYDFLASIHWFQTSSYCLIASCRLFNTAFFIFVLLLLFSLVFFSIRRFTYYCWNYKFRYFNGISRFRRTSICMWYLPKKICSQKLRNSAQVSILLIL